MGVGPLEVLLGGAAAAGGIPWSMVHPAMPCPSMFHHHEGHVLGTQPMTAMTPTGPNIPMGHVGRLEAGSLLDEFAARNLLRPP